MSSVSLWRIAKHTRDYLATDLSGSGAKKTGGRWNAKGRPLVYTSGSIALATLETLVHLGDDIAIRNAFLVRLDVPLGVWEQRESCTLACSACWFAPRLKKIKAALIPTGKTLWHWPKDMPRRS